MYISGYREEKRKEILLAGLKGYQKQLDLDERGIRKLYPPKEEGKTKRVAAKLNGRAEWFSREKEGCGSEPGSDPAFRRDAAPHWRQPGGAGGTGNALDRSQWGEWSKTLPPARISTSRQGG